MNSSRVAVGGLGVLALAFTALYGPVLLDLTDEWYQNENYSHGFLILPVAFYFAWQRRADLARLTPTPSAWGIPLVLGGLATLLVGTAGIELFLTRVSMVPVIAGAIVLLYGWRHLQMLAFPVALLLLMIPLPAIIFNQIAFPLQLLATKFGVSAVQLFDIPVLREGNVIVLASTTLEVAEACSGIRSLVSLFTVSILFGYLSQPGAAARTVIALSAVPTAIVANGLRVAGTGIAAQYFGAEAATGFFHSFSGWLVFVASFAMILGVERCVRVASWRPRAATMPATTVCEAGQS
jgi:exosortase